MKKGLIFRFILITLGALLYFIAHVQRVSVPGSVFDVLQTDLNTNPASITALGASFMYLYAISQFFTGLLIAKDGGYRVLQYGSLFFVVGCILFPLATALWVLYLSRAFIGLGAATFYLAMVDEIKKNVARKNFSIAISFMLFIGFIGGIMAGAPLVICVQKLGWRTLFGILAVSSAIITMIYLIIKSFIPPQKPNDNIHFDFDLYKNIFKKKENIALYTFGCLNYSLYYIFQTVLGKKFLEDFAHFPVMKAAVIISLMSAVYAVAGPGIAFISRIFQNRKTIFIKIASCNTLFSMAIILIFLIFNIHSGLVSITLCTLSFFASLSPILISLVYDMSKKEEASVSMSVMTSIFFLIVAVLANISGYILTVQGADDLHGAYISIFSMLTILAIISLLCGWKIKEAEITQRFLNIQTIRKNN